MTSISHVPPQPQPIDRFPAPGEQPPPDGESFADVLAQLLGGGADGDDLDAGDQRVAHFAGAEMFNEDGLFHSGIQGGPAIAPEADLQAGAAPVGPANPASPPRLAPSPSLPTAFLGTLANASNVAVPLVPGPFGADEAPLTNADGPTGSPSAGSLKTGDAPVAETLIVEQPVAQPTAGMTAVARMPAPSVRPESQPEPAPPPLKVEDAGAALDAQVVMHDAAPALHVAARIDRATSDERLRLRDRIVAVLARHGLTIGDVRVGAPGAAQNDQGRE